MTSLEAIGGPRVISVAFWSFVGRWRKSGKFVWFCCAKTSRSFLIQTVMFLTVSLSPATSSIYQSTVTVSDDVGSLFAMLKGCDAIVAQFVATLDESL